MYASTLACVGIVVGSLGPWTSFSALSRTGINESGVITAGLGLLAGLAFVTLLVRGVTAEVKNHCIGPLVGMAVLIVAVGNAAAILRRGTEIAGNFIGPSMGWGLWMVIASAIVLCISSSTVAQSIRVQAAE